MKYGFGVDVGGTTVKLGLLSEAGELLEKWELPTRTENGGENILPDIARSVQDCMARRGLARDDCLGLGIGVPGPVDASGMVNRCVNLNWGVFNLHDALGILTGLRVRAGNDANCAALGEFWMGGGSGCRSAIFVTLGTGIGGGVIRDVILGATPPATFQSPIYAVVALITSAVLFWPRLRQLFMWDPALYDLAMLVMDSAGLGIFTVMGIRIAYAQVDRPGWFLLVFVGVVTGVGGGVLRDVLAGDTPYIFVKHIYACASLAGALVCTALWRPAGELPAMLAGAGTVLAIRFLSAHFHWNLPHADD